MKIGLWIFQHIDKQKQLDEIIKLSRFAVPTGFEPAFLFKTKDHFRKDGWSKFLAVTYANPYLRSLAKNECLHPS
jgi:hypothetical protein